MRPWVYRGSVAVIGVLGQLGHVQEHVAQVGYWLGNPERPGTGLADEPRLHHLWREHRAVRATFSVRPLPELTRPTA